MAATVPAAGQSTSAAQSVTRLALEVFVQQAVVQNATAQASRLQAQAAGRLVDAERALYDPTLMAARGGNCLTGRAPLKSRPAA
jgi:hypothetical protein